MTDEINKNPEDLVNETVEKMKEKIEEISKEAEKVDGENSQKANEIKDNAVKVLNTVAEKLQKTWDTIKDPEELKKTLDFVSEKSKEIYEGSIKSIDEFLKSEEVKKYVDNAEEFIKDAGEKIGEVAKNTYDKAMENPDIKEFADDVTKTFDDVKKGVDEFFEKPEVKQAIDKAKDTTIKVAENAVVALKNWLQPKEETNQEAKEVTTEEKKDDVTE